MRTLLLICCLLPLALSAQPWQAGLRVQAGGGVGWWTWNRGLDEQEAHQGHDRTHLSLLLSSGTEVWVSRNRWQLSLGGSLQQLRDDEMVGTNHARGNYQRYQVIPKDQRTLRLQAVFLGVGYELVQRPGYSLVPQLRLGTFGWNQTHPEAAQMGLRLVRELSLVNRFRLSPQAAFICWPRLSNWYVGPNAAAAPQEGHRILHIDLGIGLECTFKSHP